jgi:MFS family permease
MSSSGIGAFIGALVVATYGHLFTPRRLALGGVWMFSTALLAFSLSRNFYVALACLLVAGFGMLLFFSTSNTVLQTTVPDEMRGRVMGVWSLVFGAMIPLGGLEAGTVAHWLGTSFALAFGARRAIQRNLESHFCAPALPVRWNQRFMMCNARFSTLSAASLTASLKVGCE